MDGFSDKISGVKILGKAKGVEINLVVSWVKVCNLCDFGIYSRLP